MQDLTTEALNPEVAYEAIETMDEADVREYARLLVAILDHRNSALRFICTANDSGPWLTTYQEAGGGYEGLQAVAELALSTEPSRSEVGRGVSE
jgi:hypothetical protein